MFCKTREKITMAARQIQGLDAEKVVIYALNVDNLVRNPKSPPKHFATSQEVGLIRNGYKAKNVITISIGVVREFS